MVAASPQGEIGTEEWETTPFVIKALSFKPISYTPLDEHKSPAFASATAFYTQQRIIGSPYWSGFCLDITDDIIMRPSYRYTVFFKQTLATA